MLRIKDILNWQHAIYTSDEADMTAIAPIIVQLVHIGGPMKGEIQELSDTEISIGRHPECQVRFAKDLVALSRRHARIVREANRFKLIDQSTNGTYVNGQRVSEVYLKDGDVLTFAEDGPKVSFLTRIDDRPAAPPAEAQASPAPIQGSKPSAPIPAYSQASPPQDQPAAPPPPPQAPAPPSAAPISIESTKAPFAIQYGPALKSFQNLPITLGKGGHCDFTINHPGLNDQQSQIFFHQNRYWIKDLTGTQAVTIDGVPCGTQAPLHPDAMVALSPQGPKFRFLEGGRLAEIEDPPPAPPPLNPEPASHGDPHKPHMPETVDNAVQKAGRLFKKFFS
jgi:pSer/pThr/pTyr-binding forkhead associated (FHA) protein